MTSDRVAKINALLHRKLIPQALYNPKDFEQHEYRRQVENGEIPHPFEAAAARRARMSPDERAAYDDVMFQRAKEVWRSIRQ